MALKTNQPAKWNELADQHFTLGQVLEVIRCTLVERKANQATVIELLADLSVLVQAHFADEEDGGFFDKIIADAPRIERRATAVLHEHLQLTKQLVQMSDLAKSGGKSDHWWSDLVTAFDEFSQAFHDHEEQENSLLQEAYNRDIGAED